LGSHIFDLTREVLLYLCFDFTKLKPLTPELDLTVCASDKGKGSVFLVPDQIARAVETTAPPVINQLEFPHPWRTGNKRRGRLLWIIQVSAADEWPL
jgi:hypothetical protein